MTQTNWTAKVTLKQLRKCVISSLKSSFRQTPDVLTPLCDPQVVLIHPGLTSLIAHIRVGRMQVALEAKSTVLPAVGRLLGYGSQDSAKDL